MMSKKLITLAIVGLIGLTMCSIALAKKPLPPPDPEPEPPYNPAIAYGLGAGLWVMNADGSNNTLVTEVSTAPFFGLRPCWSPDGLKLAFVHRLPEDPISVPKGIITVNLDGSDLFYVTRSMDMFRWSPGDVLGQGDKIIFSAPDESDPDGQWDIFMVNPDGTGLFKLAETPDILEDWLNWSPEGDRIAVVGYDLETWDMTLYIYELAVDSGGVYVDNVRNINDEAAGYGKEYPTDFGYIDWANTQEKIVSRAWGQLWIFDLGPPYNMRQITGEGYDAYFPGAYVRTPAWSPDDTRIAFAVVNASGRYKKSAGIYVVNADGTNTEKLEGGECRQPDWYRYAE